MVDFIHGVILHTAAQKDPSKYAEALPYFERASQKINPHRPAQRPVLLRVIASRRSDA